MYYIKHVESQGMRLLKQLFLHGKRLFNMQDITEAANIEQISSNQINNILSNLAKHKQVLRLRRGLYVAIETRSEQLNIHSFAISSSLIQPSAISHWSALQHHGLTEQIPQIITATTPKKIITPSMRKKQLIGSKLKHAWEIFGIRYEYITVQENHFFGLEKIWLDEYSQVLITDRERTLLDAFIFSKMFGGMGAALGILENALLNIDTRKLVRYTIQYNKKSLSKRLGWALEYFGIPTEHYGPLLKVPIHYYCRLDPSVPSIGAYNKRWMIQNNLIKSEENATITFKNSNRSSI